MIAPKANRMLMIETQLPQPDGSLTKESAIKQKKSLRRLSDMMKSGSDQIDFWIV